ncbi:MAG: hypothetical protein QM762_19645 [Chryseolinea sp.]
MILFVPRSTCAVSSKRRGNSKIQKSHNGFTALLFSVGFLFSLAGKAAIPSLSIGAGASAYPEGTPSIVVVSSMTVTDADNSIASAIVQISSGFVLGDMLTFTAAGGVIGVYDATTGILTLTGVTTPLNYKAILQSVRYANSSSPLNGSRTFSYTVNDGTTASNTVTRSITLNDKPVLSSIEAAALAYTEEDTATNHY